MKNVTDADRGKKSPLDMLYVITGTFVAVCYLFYAASCAAKAMYRSLVLPAAVLALVIVPVLLRNVIKKRAPRLYRPLRLLFVCGMALYTVTFLLFCGIVLTRPQTWESGKNDGRAPVVIVFGCYTKGYEPGGTLANRLDRASELLNEEPAAVCIVSGAQGANETVTEAEAMKKYLVERRGIPSGRVIEENRAYNSIENLLYSLEIIEGMEENDPRIVCVSSEFHTPRISLIARRAGVGIETANAASGSMASLASDLVREYMAYVKFFLFGNRYFTR